MHCSWQAVQASYSAIETRYTAGGRGLAYTTAPRHEVMVQWFVAACTYCRRKKNPTKSMTWTIVKPTTGFLKSNKKLCHLVYILLLYSFSSSNLSAASSHKRTLLIYNTSWHNFLFLFLFSSLETTVLLRACYCVACRRTRRGYIGLHYPHSGLIFPRRFWWTTTYAGKVKHQ